MNPAKVEAAVRGIHGIPGAVRAGRDLSLKPGVEGSLIDEGGVGRRKGMGESPERGGVPGDVDPASGPAVRATGTRGTGRRGGGKQRPRSTVGMRRRALRGGKGGGRAFGRRLRNRGEAMGRRGQTALTVGLEGDSIQERKVRRSRGCQTLGMRRGRGRRGGRGVTSHGDRADGEDRGDGSRGGGRRGGSTANH